MQNLSSPAHTDLHQIVRKNYRQVFFEKEINGTILPFHLEREFQKYLKCGILSQGLARFQFPFCKKEKLVAFSCKGRTICPRCTGRRMADTAKHLIEEVIPKVPIRQWVLSMPYTHRFLLATRPKFLRKVLAIYHRAVSNFYLKEAKRRGLLQAKVGAISVIQRFGGALNLNVHFHTIYTDGVFYQNANDELRFEEIIPSHEDVENLADRLKRRINRLLFREDHEQQDEMPHEAMIGNSVQNRDEKFQLPIPVGKLWDPPFEEFKGLRCCYADGFSLHANVKIKAHKRDSLDQLCRYILRGPLAKERIIQSESGMVLLKLKKSYSDGTTHLKFTPEQFIKRIISLIPPPRQNLIRYVGVFGARHKSRKQITSLASAPKEGKAKKTYRTPWAKLMKHVFKYEVNYCDHCGTKLELIACISSQAICQKILEHLKIPLEEYTVKQPQAPPETDFVGQVYEDFS